MLKHNAKQNPLPSGMGSIKKKYKVLSVCCAVLLVVVVMLWSSGMIFKNKGEIVKVYMLEGTISESYSSASYDITPKLMSKCFSDAIGYGALVLRINSPGGSVVASQEILGMIRNFKEGSGIPVIVSFGETGASGAYYIALGADKIIASPGTLTGSIGVISEFMYLKGLYGKLGIDTEIVKSGKYKDIGIETMTDEQKSVMQAICDDIYNQFVEEVASSRNMAEERVRELATGEVFTGNQALANGLIDAVGSLDDAIDMAVEMGNLKGEKVEIKYMSSSGLGIFGMLSDIRSYLKELVTFGYTESVRW